MAEVRVVEEVARVGVVTYKDKHTVGVKKATQVKSWRSGILAREKKLERIDKATELSRVLVDRAIAFAREKGIPFLAGINGLAFQAIRLKYLGYVTEIEGIKQAVPSEWRTFIDEIVKDEQLLAMYAGLRMVRV